MDFDHSNCKKSNTFTYFSAFANWVSAHTHNCQTADQILSSFGWKFLEGLSILSLVFQSTLIFQVANKMSMKEDPGWLPPCKKAGCY